MFRDQRLWHDALRIAEDYLPSKVQEIHMELASGQANQPVNIAGWVRGQGLEYQSLWRYWPCVVVD